jgi:hypothetical protein
MQGLMVCSEIHVVLSEIEKHVSLIKRVHNKGRIQNNDLNQV